MMLPPLESDEDWIILCHVVRITTSGAIYRLGSLFWIMDPPLRVLRCSNEWVFARGSPMSGKAMWTMWCFPRAC